MSSVTTVALAGLIIESPDGTQNGSLRVPVGSTAQRPTSPTEGLLRFNTSFANLEIYQLGEWKRVNAQPPEFVTTAGSLGSRYTTQSSNFTIQATSPDPISYSIAAGSLPPGTTINASTGVITGVISAGAAPDFGSTTYTFTVRAAASGLFADRAFSIQANSRFVGFRCSTAGEGGTCSDTAPSGFSFIRVDFSSYGTPNGGCGSFSIGGCNSGSSNGYNPTPTTSYAVGATNGNWGDPCGGTVKRMYIQMSWGPTGLS